MVSAPMVSATTTTAVVGAVLRYSDEAGTFVEDRPQPQALASR